jgi:hypothetical protein
VGGSRASYFAHGRRGGDYEREWQGLLTIFHDSLNNFKVPEKEQNDILGIIESTKGDIVVPPSKTAAK